MSIRRLPILTPLLWLHFVAVLGLWLRSHGSADHVGWSRGKDEAEHSEWRTLSLTSSGGGVRMTQTWQMSEGPHPEFVNAARRRRATSRPAGTSGFYWRTDRITPYPVHRVPILGFSWSSDADGTTFVHADGQVRISHRHSTFTVPYWFLALLALLPLLPRLPRLGRAILCHRHRPAAQDLLLAYAPFLAIATLSTAAILLIYRAAQYPVLSAPILAVLLTLTGWWGWCRSDALKGHRRTHSPPTIVRCIECGYDLRATPDRCPECGATAKHQVVRPRPSQTARTP